MSRTSPTRRPLSRFTLIGRLLALRDQVADLFHPRRSPPTAPARLGLEAMEERLVPDGRPLPNPVVFVGDGGGTTVQAYNAETGALNFQVQVYQAGFDGGVRVGTADLTGDGFPDVACTPGPGHAPRVKVFDGVTGEPVTGPLANFLAYGSGVTGGVYIAAADVDGDGTADLVTAAVTADGPRVKAFSGADGSVIANFVVSGQAFAGGVTVAAADLNADGKAEVVVGAVGPDGQGKVRTYDPLTKEVIAGPLGQFRAFGSGYSGGVFIGADSLAGDITADGTPDLVVGTAAGEARVRAIDGATGAVLHDFLPFGAGATGGARVGLAYVSDDEFADLVVGTGPGTTAQVKVFDGVSGAQLADPMGQYSPFGSSQDGVHVAASNDPLGGVITLYANGGTSNLTLADGQVFTLSATVAGIGTNTPTGTVEFFVTDAYSATIWSSTQSLATTTAPTAATPTLTVALPAGTYQLNAAYSGGAGDPGGFYGPSVTLLDATASADTGVPPPLAPASGSCECDGPVAPPAGDGAGTRKAGTASGVDARGNVQAVRSDLSSGGYGLSFGQDWAWTNAGGYADGLSGTGAMQTQVPHLVRANGDDSVALVSNGRTAHFFDFYGGSYHGRLGSSATNSHDTTNHVFNVTDGTGQTFTFYDFSGSTPTGQGGKLKSMTDSAGGVTEVTSWDGSGRPTEVQRVSGTGGSALTESFLSTYVASGTNAGLLETVTQRTKVGTGSWTTVRSTAYTYYDGTTGPGLAGELKTAVVKDASGTTIDTSYYRYYTSGTGTSGKLKYEFGPDAYARLTTALGTSLDSLTDSQVDDFADTYLNYDTSGRVTMLVKAGAGCSVCSGGLGTYTFSYSTHSSAGLLVTNEWTHKVVETLPDGTTNTVYTNTFGQVMLAVYTDSSANQWRSYTKYDDQGRVVLQAAPSAVSGFNDSYADLVHYSSGNAQYLSDSAGRVTAYTYGSSTTATTSILGDAAGFLKQVDLKRGETGTAVPQGAMSYLKRTAGGVDFFFAVSTTAYRNDDGTGGRTVESWPIWQGSTAMPESITTTLPAVTTAQNGPNTVTETTTVFDSFGRPVWSADQAGSLTYVQYDTVTGAVTKTITDVNTANTGDFANLPSGWSSSGEHLITTFEVDTLGRVTKTTSPEGRIDYTVYLDTAHEVRHYAGWDTTNNVPTGPISVSRTDQGNGYTETLTMSATAAVSSNRPTGAESIAKVQSLSRSYVNAVGQVTHTDVYFDLAGLTYSTSTSLGTSGVNFYRTQYAYDNHGQMNKTTSPEGTIYRTVYDDMGRAKSEWVGTDDTPTSGNWSPTNLTGTNTVKVREYEYDGGSVGDGNLTKVTEYPGGGAANRVTQTWFDWRNRSVAVKSGVEGSESTSVNRPLAVYTYDNLGELTQTLVYDGDGITPTISSGVLSMPGGTSDELRAKTTASFDELGRAYRSEVYFVDPSDGTIDSDTLQSDTWFDARGNVLKTASPGGLVAKYVYDGAGRVTTSYLTDGGGDSDYYDGDDLVDDTVLEQSETTFSDDGLVLSTLSRMRFHDASGTGALGSPSSGIGARVSYTGYYYDANSGRPTATVDVGTNAGSSWTRPGSVPSRSDTVLVTSYGYAADAVQVVTLTGSPTGGTFTLTFGGQTTSGIAYNASAATVDAAVEALSSVGSGNAVVTAAAGGGWQVRFAGTLAAKYQAKMTASGAGLTGGSSPSVAISTLSQGGDTGAVAEVTDPEALVSRTYSDQLGRATQTIENFTDGAFADSSNKTTQFAYNSAGMTSLTAVLTGGGVQTTAWVYGITQGGGNGIDSNDLVGATRWPDPSTGAASGSEQETTTVNALGQALTATDRNGSVHTLTYDVLGRVTIDAVTTLGSGVDGSVRRIETAYDGQGNAYLITSYDAATSGNIVNQVQREFNGLGQMVAEWQEHAGAVDGSTPAVEYAFSEMPSGANHSRLTSITYPSGYVLTYNYASGLNSDISRLSSLSDTSGTLESYSYLGLSIVVTRGHPQPEVDLTYIGSPGDAGDQYAGLDRFGRVVDQLWFDTDASTATDQFGYGYDRNSNRTSRDNLIDGDFDESYGYDDLNQLVDFTRDTHTQEWNYDAAGNWESLTTDGGSPESRTHNAQNEVTQVGSNNLAFDANGNLTTDETGRQFIYDAWNRLVEVQDDEDVTLKTYSYDGLGRRVSEDDGTDMTDLYYSASWQVLEEAIEGDTTKRYVWSPVYVDAMILRDRDTDGNGSLDERLWVQQDANWNVTALVNGSGTVVERYAYDPYGVRTVYDASYTVRGGGSSYGWNVFWQGMVYDSVSGSYRSRFRTDISPTLGRPFQLDPLGVVPDTNPYRWEANSPATQLDPSGLQRAAATAPLDRARPQLQIYRPPADPLRPGTCEPVRLPPGINNSTSYYLYVDPWGPNPWRPQAPGGGPALDWSRTPPPPKPVWSRADELSALARLEKDSMLRVVNPDLERLYQELRRKYPYINNATVIIGPDVITGPAVFVDGIQARITDPAAQREYQEYKKRCSEPLPPELQRPGRECDAARWKLQRNQDCKRMRQAWDDKWMPGRHAQAISELQNSINNLIDWIARNCP